MTLSKDKNCVAESQPHEKNKTIRPLRATGYIKESCIKSKAFRRAAILITFVVASFAVCSTFYNSGYSAGYTKGYSDSFRKAVSVSSTNTGKRKSSGSTNTGTSSSRQSAVSDGYIGNRKTKKYHRSTCSFLPDQSNQVVFDSTLDAELSGYETCNHCNP